MTPHLLSVPSSLPPTSFPILGVCGLLVLQTVGQCFVLFSIIVSIMFTTLWIFLDKAINQAMSSGKSYLYELKQIQGHLGIWWNRQNINSQVCDLKSKCFTRPGDVATFYSQTFLRTLDVTLYSFYLGKLKPKHEILERLLVRPPGLCCDCFLGQDLPTTSAPPSQTLLPTRPSWNSSHAPSSEKTLTSKVVTRPSYIYPVTST